MVNNHKAVIVERFVYICIKLWKIFQKRIWNLNNTEFSTLLILLQPILEVRDSQSNKIIWFRYEDKEYVFPGASFGRLLL